MAIRMNNQLKNPAKIFRRSIFFRTVSELGLRIPTSVVLMASLCATQAYAGGAVPCPPGKIPLGFGGTGFAGFSSSSSGAGVSGVTSTSNGGSSTSGAGVSGVTSTSSGGSATGGAGGQSTSSASTGAQTLSTGSQSVTLGNAGNTSTSIDASDRSVSNASYNQLFIPAIIPQTPPSSLAAGGLIKETSNCGPLMAIQRIPITGAFFGMVKRQDVQQGFTESLVPYLDRTGHQQMYLDVPLPTGDGYTRFGHRVVQTTTVIGTAGARNLAIGGGGSGGGWGQAGGGASSSMQQMVTTIQLQYCEIGEFKTRPHATPVSLPLPPAKPPVPPVLQRPPKQDRY